MEAVAEKIIGPFVDVAIDLRFGLEAYDRSPRQMAVRFLSELCQKSHRSRKSLRQGGDPALLVFVHVQIRARNGGPQENRVGIALDPDFILAACIDEPGILPRANF